MPDQGSDDIKNAGEKIATIPYRGNCNDDVGMLRKQILAKQITTSKSFVEPKHLPPTKHSLKYHSYRGIFPNFEMDEYSGYQS